jgi:PEP-CTERM motif
MIVAGAIFHIDIRTGDRTIVSSSAMGTGPVFGNPTTLAFDASDLLLVGDQVHDGVFSVDGRSVSGGAAAVPVPGTMVLFGMSMFGLARILHGAKKSLIDGLLQHSLF